MELRRCLPAESLLVLLEGEGVWPCGLGMREPPDACECEGAGESMEGMGLLRLSLPSLQRTLLRLIAGTSASSASLRAWSMRPLDVSVPVTAPLPLRGLGEPSSSEGDAAAAALRLRCDSALAEEGEPRSDDDFVRVTVPGEDEGMRDAPGGCTSFPSILCTYASLNSAGESAVPASCQFPMCLFRVERLGFASALHAVSTSTNKEVT